MNDWKRDARLHWVSASPSLDLHARFVRDVQEGLTRRPKRLPCWYFYDAEGSRLFEAICQLPEYYLTRTERMILATYIDAIVRYLPEPVHLVELGSGSAVKTRILMEALLRRQGTLHYTPIDISRTALEESARALLDGYPTLQITAIHGEYRDGLTRLNRMDSKVPRCFLWLGSSIGNFDPPEAVRFLAAIRQIMKSDDCMIVGMDLHKAREVLEPAYNDARGVTAQFNRNLLARINRELGGRFDLNAFEHRAVYNEAARRIEMHLVSIRAQRVRIEALNLDVEFKAGESIHTENSYKYTQDDIVAITRGAGLRIEAQWTDPRRWFAVVLLRPT